MSEKSSRNQITSLQKKWNGQLQFAHLLLALAITLLLSAIVIRLVTINWIMIATLFLLSFLLLIFLLKEKTSENEVADFLNQSNPNFQESAHLILKPEAELNQLERWQLKKIETLFYEKISTPKLIKRKMIVFSFMLIGAFLITFLIFSFPTKADQTSSKNNTSNHSLFPVKPETQLPEIKKVSITILSPAYTHKSERQQDKFNISAEQNAVVSWVIQTTHKASDIQLLFNDKTILHLTSTDKEHTKWTTRKPIITSGFYQVIIDGKQSQLYTIEMIPDLPPVIVVTSPSPNTMIKLGQEKKINISVFVSDDYGIDSAYIKATTANGSGEAVTFKQLQIPFATFRSDSQNLHLQKEINLSSLSMSDGDELYFYIVAQDNNKQQKRSDVYLVRLEDSAQLMSMAGVVNGLDIKPELFRSERQIIIETEQLLRDKDTISENSFKERSNDLGSDQQLLRLRYGKYLGEETQTQIGAQNDNAAQGDASDYGNAAKVIDEYSDKHDAAEDADFFDAPTKKQLQAMLTEMWKASLQLKTYKPKDALPFEYNALRLLKDLQQKTRAYVAKTGVQTTPLNVDKRLTGELDKVIQPSTEETVKEKDSLLFVLRKSLGILEKIRSGEILQKSDVTILSECAKQLSMKAASEPNDYVSSYQSLLKIVDGKQNPTDIMLAGKAFQKMIQSINLAPQQLSAAPDMNLSKQYFMKLNRQHD